MESIKIPGLIFTNLNAPFGVSEHYTFSRNMKCKVDNFGITVQIYFLVKPGYADDGYNIQD